MDDKPTYEELDYRVRLLEREARWREEAQRTLKEREAYLQILFDFAPDMYILCDSNGRLIDANRTAEKVTGYRRTEVVGKDLFEAGIIDADQFEKALNVLSKVASNLPTDPEEFTIRKKSGKTIAAELRAFPVEMQDEPVVLMIARDISHYRAYIESLKARGLLFARSFEKDPEAILVLEKASGRIQEANRAACRLFGYTPEELQNRRIEALCKETPENRSFAEDLRSAESGPRTLAFRGFRTRAGEPIPARVHLHTFTLGDQILMAVRIRQG